MGRIKIAVVLGVSLFATQVHAVTDCAPRDDVTQHLSDRFGEYHHATGLQTETGLIEIWASETTGSWTILLTRPDGQSCVLSSGSHFLLESPMVELAGEPA